MTTEINPVFTFWIENKVAQERQFYISDIRQKFQKWLFGKGKEWLEYYGSQTAVLAFIADKDGLNAVHDQKDTDEIVRFLKPDCKSLMNGVNPVTKTPMQ